MIEVLTSYADNLPMKIQGSSKCQTVAPSIHLLLSAHSTDLALCWTTSKQSESFSISWWCQMILYTSPYKFIPTADVWYSSWLHIQEKPLVFYIIHIVSHWAVCRLCRLHLDHLNCAVSVVSFTGVQVAPDLVFNMTTKLAWLANFVAGEYCNVPLVISNILAMFPACNGKQEAEKVDFAKHPVPNSQSGKPILPFHNCTSLMSSLVCGSSSCGGFPWTSHMQVCN